MYHVILDPALIQHLMAGQENENHPTHQSSHKNEAARKMSILGSGNPFSGELDNESRNASLWQRPHLSCVNLYLVSGGTSCTSKGNVGRSVYARLTRDFDSRVHYQPCNSSIICLLLIGNKLWFSHLSIFWSLSLLCLY